MRLALVSDAWTPQVNGVVRTLSTTVAALRAQGHDVETITPDGFRNFACPTYPEIGLALGASGRLGRRMAAFGPEAVHIATEGPLGWAARRWCLRQGMPFTTSFHTRFPEYVAMRTGLSPEWFWPVIRRFHAPAQRIMVATATLRDELTARGLRQTHLWSRGVDLAQFNPDAARHPALAGLPRPIQLYVGRVSIEKNITAFLDCPTPGAKVVVGDGPALAALRATYSQAVFLGALHGAELASAYASANVFVFPSRTDTFGLVMIEALASGIPVAGFPVPGPEDVIGRAGNGTHGGSARIGCLSDDLRVAIEGALSATRAACEAEAQIYSWRRCTDQFVTGLVSTRAGAAGWTGDARTREDWPPPADEIAQPAMAIRARPAPSDEGLLPPAFHSGVDACRPTGGGGPFHSHDSVFPGYLRGNASRANPVPDGSSGRAVDSCCMIDSNKM